MSVNPSALLRTIFLLGVLSTVALSAKLKQESPIVSLTFPNYKDNLAQSDFFLVEFFSPYCPHCQQFAPIYKEIADKISTEMPNVKVGNVDTSSQMALTNTFGITEVPKLIFFKGSTAVIYHGKRDFDKIVNWVRQEMDPNFIMMQKNQKNVDFLEIEDPVCKLDLSAY